MSPHSMLLLITLISSASADFGTLEDLEDLKKCPQFQCPAGQSPVHRSLKKFTSPGCTGWGSTFMVGNDYGVATKGLVRCCDRVHSCYQTCGFSKKACADAFIKCTTRVCKSKQNDDTCLRESKSFEFQVSMSSCDQYAKAQEKACKCVNEDLAKDKRRKVLEAFYKKRKPEKLDTLGELVDKYDTPEKFAQLVQKLVAKYPDIVRRIVDPEQAKVEEILRKAQAGAFDTPGKPVKIETDADVEEDADAMDLDEEQSGSTAKEL